MEQNKIYNRAYSTAKNVCFLKRIYPDAVEDIASSVAAKFLLNYKNFDPSVGSEMTFIFKMVENALVDRYRTVAYKFEINKLQAIIVNSPSEADKSELDIIEAIEDVGALTSEDKFDYKILKKKVIDFLEKNVKPIEKNILIDYLLNDMSAPAIARKYSKKEENVKVIIHRTKKKLKKHLKK